MYCYIITLVLLHDFRLLDLGFREEVEEVVRRCNGKGLKGFLSFHFSDIVQLEEVSSFLGELFEDDGRCFSVLSLCISS